LPWYPGPDVSRCEARLSLQALLTTLLLPPILLVLLCILGGALARGGRRAARLLVVGSAVLVLLLATPLVSGVLLVSLERVVPRGPAALPAATGRAPSSCSAPRQRAARTGWT